MRAPGRLIAAVLALGLPLAGLIVTSAQAADPYSGPYVKLYRPPLGGPIGTVLGIAHLRDDSILLASSVSADDSGVLDIRDNPGDNNNDFDDSVTFAAPVLGVGVNQVEDTIYAVTSDATPRLVVAALRDTTIDDTVALATGSGGFWSDVAINNADDTVYVASQDDASIYIFNGANLDDSRAVPLTLPAGLTPRAIAIDQRDDTIYVLSSDSVNASRLTAMRGIAPDDSVVVSTGVDTLLQSLAVNQVNGSVYVGGRFGGQAQVEVFTPALAAADWRSLNASAIVMGLDVSQDGRRLYATASNGSVYLLNTANLDDSASVTLGVADPGAVVVDDYGWAWTASPSSNPAPGARSLVQIGTAPTFTAITPASGYTSGGYPVTITGSWFTEETIAAFGAEANVGTRVGVPTSNSMTVTVPSRAAGAATLILTNVAGNSQPLGINNSGSFTYVNPPPPPPPTYPPSPPLGVSATAGDASATVTWTAPATSGSFPISSYAVTSAPEGKTCVTSTLTRQVTGLTNGTTYTFTVKAINGAGSSNASSPSNAVTPTAPPTPTIVITGSRDGTLIRVAGTTAHLAGTVTPWIKFPGQMTYAAGAARPAIVDDGFAWSRKVNKKTYVYFTHDAVKSNTVTIAAR